MDINSYGVTLYNELETGAIGEVVSYNGSYFKFEPKYFDSGTGPALVWTTAKNDTVSATFRVKVNGDYINFDISFTYGGDKPTISWSPSNVGNAWVKKEQDPYSFNHNAHAVVYIYDPTKK